MGLFTMKDRLEMLQRNMRVAYMNAETDIKCAVANRKYEKYKKRREEDEDFDYEDDDEDFGYEDDDNEEEIVPYHNKVIKRSVRNSVESGNYEEKVRERFEDMLLEIASDKSFGKRNPIDIGIDLGYSEQEVQSMLEFIQEEIERNSSSEETIDSKISVEFYLQFSGKEYGMDELYDIVKREWKDSGNKLENIEEIKLFLKPEDSEVYYVINNSEDGIIDI